MEPLNEDVARGIGRVYLQGLVHRVNVRTDFNFKYTTYQQLLAVLRYSPHPIRGETVYVTANLLLDGIRVDSALCGNSDRVFDSINANTRQKVRSRKDFQVEP